MALTITSISPDSGPLAGGTTVRITGTDLDTVTGVTIGGEAATFSIENEFLIKATVPAGATAEAVDVVVDDGVAPATLAGGYTYTANVTDEPLAPTQANKYILEARNYGATEWTRVRAIADFKPPLDPNMEDDSDYDGEGWASEAKTQLKWSIEVKVIRKVGLGSKMYDPGQELLRAASTKFGAEGLVEVRWYDRHGGPEAYQGFANVVWSPEGGDTKALDIVTVTLSGSGKRTDIVNPAA